MPEKHLILQFYSGYLKPGSQLSRTSMNPYSQRTWSHTWVYAVFWNIAISLTHDQSMQFLCHTNMDKMPLKSSLKLPNLFWIQQQRPGILGAISSFPDGLLFRLFLTWLLTVEACLVLSDAWEMGKGVNCRCMKETFSCFCLSALLDVKGVTLHCVPERAKNVPLTKMGMNAPSLHRALWKIFYPHVLFQRYYSQQKKPRSSDRTGQIYCPLISKKEINTTWHGRRGWIGDEV